MSTRQVADPAAAALRDALLRLYADPLASPAPGAEAPLLAAAHRLEARLEPHAALRTLRDAGLADLDEHALADPSLPRLPAATVALLKARAAQMFDEVDDALQAAARAGTLAGADDDEEEPVAAAAAFVHGLALVDAGRPADALPRLERALRAARRDALPHLERLAAQALARALDDLGRAAEASTLLDAVLAATGPGDASRPVVRSLRRLARRLQLNALAPDAADEAPPGGDQDYWSFPDRVLHALAALRDGRTADADAIRRALEVRARLDFHCARWRADLLQLQVWCAWARGDDAALDTLASPPAGAAGATAGGQGTHAAWREAVARLAAAVLRRSEAPLPFDALEAELGRRALHALAGTVALLRALHAGTAAGDDAADRAFAAWCTTVAAPTPLDLLWLAPLAAPRLQAFLRGRDSVANAAARRWCAAALAKIAPPALPGPDGESGPLPPGLTRREWVVLCAIANGWSNEQIAARLHVSLATVKTHVNHLYGKLGLRHRAEAVARGRALAAALAAGGVASPPG